MAAERGDRKTRSSGSPSISRRQLTVRRKARFRREHPARIGQRRSRTGRQNALGGGCSVRVKTSDQRAVSFDRHVSRPDPAQTPRPGGNLVAGVGPSRSVVRSCDRRRPKKARHAIPSSDFDRIENLAQMRHDCSPVDAGSTEFRSTRSIALYGAVEPIRFHQGESAVWGTWRFQGHREEHSGWGEPHSARCGRMLPSDCEQRPRAEKVPRSAGRPAASPVISGIP